MAKGKKPSKRPQAKHKPKSRSSQHDKRKRLDTPNLRRKKTVKAKVPLTGKMAVLVTSMAGMLDSRMAFRLSIIMAGRLTSAPMHRSSLHNCPRNAGKTISGGSAFNPKPAEIQVADQGRDQPVYMTKTLNRPRPCLLRQIPHRQFHALGLRLPPLPLAGREIPA